MGYCQGHQKPRGRTFGTDRQQARKCTVLCGGRPREVRRDIDRDRGDRAKLASDGKAKHAKPVGGDAARATLVWCMASV